MLYLFLETGFEETEALATLDMIRRAGLEIQTVSPEKNVTGAHGITVMADLLSPECDLSQLSGVILPGGMPGTEHLGKNPLVKNALGHAFRNELLIAAICAAPSILGELGYLEGKQATVFPGFENKLKGAVLSEKPVVRDQNIITAKAMGASFLFGAEIISYLLGEQTAQRILESIYAG